MDHGGAAGVVRAHGEEDEEGIVARLARCSWRAAGPGWARPFLWAQVFMQARRASTCRPLASI
jgi:hypothetical protein